MDLYIDDGLVASTDSAGQEFLNELKSNFKITTNPASYSLGMEINKGKDCSKNLKTAYAKKVLKRFVMENSKPVSCPAMKIQKVEEPTKKSKISISNLCRSTGLSDGRREHKFS